MALALAKPAPGAYTINEAAQHYPPFLWVPDMDTGATTIVNRGSGATATLAMTGMTRHEDGTHGAYWRSNAGSSGRALLDQDLGLTTGFSMVFIARVALTTGGNLSDVLGGLGTNGHVNNRVCQIQMSGSTGDTPGRTYGRAGTVAPPVNSTNYSADWHIFSLTVNFTGNVAIKVNTTAQATSAVVESDMTEMGRRIVLGSAPGNTAGSYSNIDILAAAIWPNTILTNTELNDIQADPWELLGVSTAAPSAQFVPVTEALYYGATRLDSKTNIRWMVTNGHGGLTGQILSSGLAGTTSAVGVFVPDATVDGDTTGAIADDPVTLHLYWEEGTPAVDRSLIVKTTLVAA